MKNYNDFILNNEINNKYVLELLEKLNKLKFNFLIHSHPPLKTVKEAKLHRKNVIGGNTKNLFIRDKKKNNFLITVEENQKIDLKALASMISADRLSFASPERLLEFLGVIPGAVSPLALINDNNLKVNFFIDQNLLKKEKLNFHPLINTLTITMDTNDFLIFLKNINHSEKYLKFE